MRILFVSSLYPPTVVGGAELGLKTLADAMVELGHEVHVATLAPEPNDAPIEIVNGVRIHRVALANIYWPWPAPEQNNTLAKGLWHAIDSSNGLMGDKLASIARDVAPDIVVTGNLQGWSTAVVPAMKKLGLPVVHVLNDYALLCPQTTLYRNGRACGVQRERCKSCRILTAPRHHHIAGVDAVVGVSQSVLEFHKAHGLFETCMQTVINNPLRADIEIVRELGQSTNSVFTFGYLGRIEQSKGIETLLNAVERLERKDIDFRVRIAGNPRSSRYFANILSQWPLARIEYIGYADAATFLDDIDCLVFPSDWLEALGNGVFEAFARGVPVIGSDAGGVPETIDHGRTGFVFEKGDHQALARHMERMVRDPGQCSRMARAAVSKAHDYLPTKRAAEYLAFFTQILMRSNRFCDA